MEIGDGDEDYNCVSEINIGEWSTKECNTEKNDEGDYVCDCKDVTPVTVVEDFKELFSDHKQITDTN